MRCEVMSAADFAKNERDAAVVMWLHLTRRGSDFSRKLLIWIEGTATPAAEDGHIAIVRSGDEVVGWARTELWIDRHGWEWETLEAFVRRDRRREGIASFAATGLMTVTMGTGNVAVFRPSMLMVARRAGLHPTLFRRVADGWEESQ